MVVRGAVLFCVALAATAVMDVLVKLGSERPGPVAMLLARSLGAIVIVAPLTVARGDWHRMRPERWGYVIVRSVLLGVGTALFFWSLSGLTLPVAYVITFSMPIIMIGLAALFLAERAGALGWLAALAGFAGILLAIDLPAVVASEEGSVSLLHAAAAFTAVVFYAIALLMVRGPVAGETTEALVVWGLIGTGAVALVLALIGELQGRPIPWPGAHEWAMLAGVAVAGAFSQLLLTRAFQIAPASKLAPFGYTPFIWGVLFAVLIWRDWPDPTTWAGAAVIIAATLIAGRATRN